ncbi:MAG: methyltransferase domain-containing protein [Methylococcales bacterium]
MNTISKSPDIALDPRIALDKWYSSPAGQRVRDLEADYLKTQLFPYYGQIIIQLGALRWEHCFLDDYWFPSLHIIEEAFAPDISAPEISVCSNYQELAITSEIADWVIIPHRLEYESDWKIVLEEAERILKPEGTLFVLGFNPWSLPHLTHFVSRGRGDFPECKGLLSRDMVMRVLQALNFQADKSVCFYPGKAIFKLTGYESRHWTLGAVSYAIRARKRRFSMLTGTSPWRIRSLIHRPAPLPSPQDASQQHSDKLTTDYE